MLRHLRLLLFLLVGCASVPKESVELSAVVGARITDVQISHEAILSAYFSISRDRIDDFFRYRFTPQFLENFVHDSKLLEQLDSVEPFTDEQKERLLVALERVLSEEDSQRAYKAASTALGGTEQGELVLQFAEAALEQIDEEKQALLGPLNDREALAIKELRGAYAELLAMQTTVTAHLQSVREVSVEQDNLLKSLGLLESRDKIVEEAIDLNGQVTNALEQGSKAQEALEEAKKLIGKD